MSDQSLEKFLNLIESSEELRRRISAERFDGDMGNVEWVREFVAALGVEYGFKFTADEVAGCLRGGSKQEDGTREIQIITKMSEVNEHRRSQAKISRVMNETLADMLGDMDRGKTKWWQLGRRFRRWLAE